MKAVNLPATSIQEVREEDQCKLELVFQFINRRYFQSRIEAHLRWEIPQGTVSVFVGTDGLALIDGHPLHPTFTQATTLLQNGQHQEALAPLQICADAGHPESELLLSHLLKRLGNERWHHYAGAYNRHLEARKAVPAACYYPDSRTIALHPYLLQRRAPQLVVKYLLYHECCHQLIPSTPERPHPPAFMEWEYCAPHRTRALEWLEKEGFPTLRQENHA